VGSSVAVPVALMTARFTPRADRRLLPHIRHLSPGRHIGLALCAGIAARAAVAQLCAWSAGVFHPPASRWARGLARSSSYRRSSSGGIAVVPAGRYVVVLLLGRGCAGAVSTRWRSTLACRQGESFPFSRRSPLRLEQPAPNLLAVPAGLWRGPPCGRRAIARSRVGSTDHKTSTTNLRRANGPGRLPRARWSLT